jgi:hypothetical protein
VENDTPVEIRKRRGFPLVFGKASQKTLGFPTFSTMPAAALDRTLLSGNQSRSVSPNFNWKTLQRKGRSQFR